MVELVLDPQISKLIDSIDKLRDSTEESSQIANRLADNTNKLTKKIKTLNWLLFIVSFIGLSIAIYMAFYKWLNVHNFCKEDKLWRKKSHSVKTSKAYESLRKDIESGKVKNYYINKEGDISQKVTVHFPIDMVIRSKKEAIDQRTILSELIRERLK